MSDTYDKIFRNVAIRANLLTSPDSTTLETNFTNAIIGQTELLDKAVEFPFSAINDSILMAADRMISAIGNNPFSYYRKFFLDVTPSISNGNKIPNSVLSTAQIVGVPTAIRDASDSIELEFAPRQKVDLINDLTTKASYYFFFTDGTRIWHTRPNVVADVVVWDKGIERIKLEDTPARGVCPFPDDLHEALICGAISYLFRSSFNNEQFQAWKQTFNEKLIELGGYQKNDQ